MASTVRTVRVHRPLPSGALGEAASPIWRRAVLLGGSLYLVAAIAGTRASLGLDGVTLGYLLAVVVEAVVLWPVVARLPAFRPLSGVFEAPENPPKVPSGESGRSTLPSPPKTTVSEYLLTICTHQG